MERWLGYILTEEPHEEFAMFERCSPNEPQTSRDWKRWLAGCLISHGTATETKTNV